MNKLLLVSVVALSVGGCANMSQRETNGALIGGASGAVIGGVATHSWGGAAVGGAIGALAGATIANLTGPHRHCWYSRQYGHWVCRYW
jgi:hypothetical protein